MRTGDKKLFPKCPTDRLHQIGVVSIVGSGRIRGRRTLINMSGDQVMTCLVMEIVIFWYSIWYLYTKESYTDKTPCRYLCALKRASIHRERELV